MRARTVQLFAASLFLLAACNRGTGGGFSDMGGSGTDLGGGTDSGGIDAGAHDAGGTDAPAGDASMAPDLYSVEFMTTKGTFVVEVNRSWAPNGADRFYQLVNAGFYDDCRFFRVVAGFVAQFGINGDPAVNRMWSSRTIPDDPVTQSNLPGTLAFAATGAPNSRTTQLFVSMRDNSYLDAMGFAPFGTIIAGNTVPGTLYSAYGEMPDQTLISSMGNTYLDSSFPNLDHIISARVLP